ncbi:hypothetical protein Pint_08247 [Pistacia integerrima]|uniref:Uncharacterized protein n=1 Tax=Pistacia integerrima TaxID=434235 RepID=A0ACC0XXR0_9ROSI|nr:hypothetical protein Pint_08247 [Pistacia integerrima]
MSFPDQNNKIARERPSRNAVIITYYVESSTTQSKHRKLKPNPFHKKAQTIRKRGYDRRAELLAYANDLRVSDPSQKVHWSRRSSRCKTNKWKWSITSARLRSVLSIRIFKGRKGRWKYKRMESEVMNTDVNKRKKNNSETTNISDICRKLKCLLKEIPFGCECYKGSRDERVDLILTRRG